MKLDLVRVGFLVTGLGALGCADEDEEFQYDREDMEAAVFGTWTGTHTANDGTAVAMQLEIRSHDEPARSLACEDRNFSDHSATPGLALACSPGSTLAVSATLVVDGAAESPPDLDGYFDVAGLTFSGGSLSLLDRATGTGFLTALLKGEKWEECRYGVGAQVTGSCTLDSRIQE
jgi:hypothetical protein